MNDKKTILDFEIHNSNPYIQPICDREIITRKDKSNFLNTSARVTDKDGKFIGSAMVKQNTTKFYDSREFIRITNEGIIAMASFQLVEYKVFCYILYILKHNDLEVVLNVEKIKEFYSYSSRNPIYKGIIGLLSNNIISRKQSKKPTYYINPIYFYKGTIVKEIFGHMSNNVTSKEIQENTEFYKQKEN